jgi:formylglycine-generating enzyme required for sulfatase activity
MALVPAGSFQMGTLADNALAECQKYRDDCDRNWIEDEEPVHTVSLDEFYIDQYEATNKQFAAFLNEQGNQSEDGSTWLDASSEGVRIHQNNEIWQVGFEYANHPVTGVSWYGAQAYCQWRGGRLPTEAEWEKAARGGLGGMFYPWGDDAPVCTSGADNGAQYSACSGDTFAVGSFAPNGYGLYDMAGNVWEWVADWYADDYYASSPENNPTGPEDGSIRVLRGGSWGSYPDSLRGGYRNSRRPSYSSSSIGFRCARSP